MKKITSYISAVLALCLFSACGDSGETVAVRSVREIVAEGSVGYVSRCAGLVVPGESSVVKIDPNMTVLEIKVSEGDMVKKGDILFSYDSQSLQLKLDKLNLEYEELRNKISSAETNIPLIEKKIKGASAADQLGYNLQIQSLRADILESTYNMNIKEREIKSLEAAMKDVDVRSPISGRVMSVKQSSPSSDSSTSTAGSSETAAVSAGSTGTGESGEPSITVTDVETLRVKGAINEMNVGTLIEGIPVLIRSRLDESVTWNGAVQKIDWENTVSSSGNMYYSAPTDEMSSSSKYPFYVDLEDFDGLLLGQHVYVEPDYGQAGEKDGLWLPIYYVFGDDSGASFVWAQNGRGKLEKRTVTTGDTDEENGTVLILSGLALSDSVAFPDENVRAGLVCVPYEDTMFADGDTDGEFTAGEPSGAVLPGGAVG